MDVGAYLSAVTSRVSRHRTYPAMALDMGQEGEVRVRVVVNPDGTLAAPPTVEESSGHELLDQEAVRIVARGDLRPEEMVGDWAGELGQHMFSPTELYRRVAEEESFWPYRLWV